MSHTNATADARPELLMMGPLPAWDMEPLADTYRLLRYWEAEDKAALLARSASVRAVLTKGDVGADAALIAALPALELIACFGVGVDAIDFPAARARGIAVTNTPDVLTEEVADIAMGLLICTLREFIKADRYLRSGLWSTQNFPLSVGSLRDR